MNTTRQIPAPIEEAFIAAIKQAYTSRQLLFDSPDGYTREEMLGANAAILKATEEWRICCQGAL